MVCPAIRFPTAFGKDGKLVGISATRDLGFNEAYLYVPMKMIICADKIRKTELGLIIDKYPDAFVIKGRKSGASTS